MSANPPSSHLLLLDLRRQRHDAVVVPEGFSYGEPDADCNVGEALAILVVVDGTEALDAWATRFHPCCPPGFPYVLLLAPFDLALAHQGIRGGAQDCIDIQDLARLSLTLARLQREVMPQAAAPAQTAYALRLQSALDTLPTPIFIKDLECRYIACNLAFQDYLGLPRERIVGGTVFDVAPPEMAAVYEQADRDLLQGGGRQIYEAKVRYADGSDHDVIFHKAVFSDPTGNSDGIAGAMLDISERKLLEKRLAVLAATDFLTSAYNLRSFYELAGRELARVARGGGGFSLLVMDIDRFKEINDCLGHAAGDDALKLVVDTARQILREQDVFSRAGGDEFRVLLPDTPLDKALQVGERIVQAISGLRVSAAKGEMVLSLSLGATTYRADDENIDQIVVRADEALYQAKSAGRSQAVGIA